MIPQCLLIALAVIQPNPTGLDGHWTNPNRSVIISIAPCNGTFCGRVEWASEKAKADAREGGTDPLIGAVLLKDIVQDGQGRWKARLFVPDVHKTSKAKLRLFGRDLLKVTGCAVGGVICRTQVWTRLAAEAETSGLHEEPRQ